LDEADGTITVASGSKTEWSNAASQNASAPVAHLEDNDFITLSDTQKITISLPAAGDDNFIKNTRVNRFEFVEGQVN
jgi:hypothetical protein